MILRILGLIVSISPPRDLGLYKRQLVLGALVAFIVHSFAFAAAADSGIC